MDTVTSTLSWQGGMAFDAEMDGHHVVVDASTAVPGGQGRGPRPKTLVMAALAGCTAMDVISVLRKMRVEPGRFEVSAQGRTRDDHPKAYTAATVTYRFEGDDLPLDKLRKAIELSRERYCMVSATLEGSIEIHAVLLVNGREHPLAAAA